MPEQRYLTVHTKDGTTQVPMSAEMAASMDEMAAFWEESGCKCDPCNTDHAITIPRGHSLDVLCGDCGGVIQIG